MTQPTTPTIRSYLTVAYNDEELTTLCADHFLAVYTDFTVGMTKTQKIRLLLDHCQRRERFPDLFAALERDRPDQYQRFLDALPQQAPADPDEPADEERQERADIEAEITAIRAAVQSQAQAAGRNQQAVLDALQCIADRVAHIDARIAALEKAGQPAQAARWRALLTRFGELALLLVGSAALREIFAQSALDSAGRDRITTLLARAGPSQAAAAPLPAATPPPKPQPKAESPRSASTISKVIQSGHISHAGQGSIMELGELSSLGCRLAQIGDSDGALVAFIRMTNILSERLISIQQQLHELDTLITRPNGSNAFLPMANRQRDALSSDLSATRLQLHLTYRNMTLVRRDMGHIPEALTVAYTALSYADGVQHQSIIQILITELTGIIHR